MAVFLTSCTQDSQDKTSKSSALKESSDSFELSSAEGINTPRIDGSHREIFYSDKGVIARWNGSGNDSTKFGNENFHISRATEKELIIAETIDYKQKYFKTERTTDLSSLTKQDLISLPDFDPDDYSECLQNCIQTSIRFELRDPPNPNNLLRELVKGSAYIDPDKVLDAYADDDHIYLLQELEGRDEYRDCEFQVFTLNIGEDLDSAKITKSTDFNGGLPRGLGCDWNFGRTSKEFVVSVFDDDYEIEMLTLINLEGKVLADIARKDLLFIG